MNLLAFAVHYKRLAFFGFSFTFFSSFGQTFLISLFVPGILVSFGISNAYFGTLYSMATLASAFSLAWIGSKIDQLALKKYALFVCGGLVLSSLFLAVSQWVWMLFIGLYGIRLFGQGLSTHTAHTAMGRYFITMRGKALSIANLGFTLGEAALPITVTALIAAFGWRAGYMGISLFVLLVLPAIILLTLGKDPGRYGEIQPRQNDRDKGKKPGSDWRRSRVLKDYRLYLLLPAAVVSPFLLTGLFLYQTQLAEFKGWDIEILASAFIAFAAAKSSFSLISGPLVDRFTACRVFPFVLIPFMLGLIILSTFTHYLTVFVYMFMAGVSEGFGFNVKTAIYAELYGTANLGAIRSMMSMFMVLSTAVSPILFGYLLDIGISFGTIIHGAVVLIVAAIILAIFIFREAESRLS